MILNKLVWVFALAAPAVAQVFPVVPYTRTFDVFVTDTFHSASLSEQENVWRLSDHNQDGDYLDAGEVIDFYDDTATDRLDVITGICCAVDGTVYVCDSSTDVVLAMRDTTGDGDANDPGEVTVFFDSAANASGIQLGAAQSIVQDVFGRIFVLTANQGTSLVGLDGIVELEDLDADGDANDANEASYYFQVPNASGQLGHSNPSEFVLAPDGGVYYSDINGGSGSPIVKGIYRAFDADGSGAIDAGESGLWWTPPFTNAAWFGMALDLAGNVYACNHGASSRRIDRAFDLDSSGTIDASEQQQVYGIGVSATWWDIARRDDGVFLLIDGISDTITALVDLTADGDFDDANEATLVFDKNAVGLPDMDLRSMALMRAPTLQMAPAVVAIGQPTTFTIRTAEPFDLAVPAAALSFAAPISLPPYGWLEIDPLSLITFGVGISDGAGHYAHVLNVANDPALIGSYACQALCGDLWRLYLGNPAPLTLTP